MENEANTACTVACCAYNNFIGFVTVIVFENGFVRLHDVVFVLNLFINVYWTVLFLSFPWWTDHFVLWQMSPYDYKNYVAGLCIFNRVDYSYTWRHASSRLRNKLLCHACRVVMLHIHYSRSNIRIHLNAQWHNINWSFVLKWVSIQLLVIASHADVLRGSSRIPAPRTANCL